MRKIIAISGNVIYGNFRGNNLDSSFQERCLDKLHAINCEAMLFRGSLNCFIKLRDKNSWTKRMYERDVLDYERILEETMQRYRKLKEEYLAMCRKENILYLNLRKC